MLTWKERLIAIAIGLGVGFGNDWVLKSLNFSNELNHFIGGCVVYLIGSVYLIFELARDGDSPFFSKFTLLWIGSDLFVLGLRVLLFWLGVLPDQGPPGSIYEAMFMVTFTIILALWLLKVLHMGPIGKGLSQKSKS